MGRREMISKVLGAATLLGGAAAANADIDYAGVGFLGGSSTIDVNNANIRVYTKVSRHTAKGGLGRGSAADVGHFRVECMWGAGQSRRGAAGGEGGRMSNRSILRSADCATVDTRACNRRARVRTAPASLGRDTARRRGAPCPRREHTHEEARQALTCRLCPPCLRSCRACTPTPRARSSRTCRSRARWAPRHSPPRHSWPSGRDRLACPASRCPRRVVAPSSMWLVLDRRSPIRRRRTCTRSAASPPLSRLP